MDQSDRGHTAQCRSQVARLNEIVGMNRPLSTISAQLQLPSFSFPVKPGSAGSRRAVFTEMLQLLLWMGSTSLSPVQTTAGAMEIASLECVSVIWDTQVMRLKDGV